MVKRSRSRSQPLHPHIQIALTRPTDAGIHPRGTRMNYGLTQAAAWACTGISTQVWGLAGCAAIGLTGSSRRRGAPVRTSSVRLSDSNAVAGWRLGIQASCLLRDMSLAMIAVMWSHEPLIDEDRARRGRSSGLWSEQPKTRHQTLQVQVVVPLRDVEAPVYAGHPEPAASPINLVQDSHGRVAQDLPRVAAVEQHAADAAVDDIGEVRVERTDMVRREEGGRRFREGSVGPAISAAALQCLSGSSRSSLGRSGCRTRCVHGSLSAHRRAPRWPSSATTSPCPRRRAGREQSWRRDRRARRTIWTSSRADLKAVPRPDMQRILVLDGPAVLGLVPLHRTRRAATRLQPSSPRCAPPTAAGKPSGPGHRNRHQASAGRAHARRDVGGDLPEPGRHLPRRLTLDACVASGLCCDSSG